MIRRTIQAVSLCLYILFLIACPNEKKTEETASLTPEQKLEKQKKEAQEIIAGVSIGFEIASRTIQTGTPIIRQYRLAGQLSPPLSKKLAIGTREGSRAMLKVSDIFINSNELNDANARTLYDDLNEVNSFVQEMQSIQYTLNPNAPPKEQIKAAVFQLSAIGAGATLQAAANRLLKIPSALNVPIPPETKAQFRRTRPVIEANIKMLDSSLKELEGIN